MSPHFCRSSCPYARFPRVSGDEPALADKCLNGIRFPRVSGDEPGPRGGIVFAWKFSPRERG